MMNDPEKSDSAIRAKKPANKAGKPAAERVEQRAGTEGNTAQPHTYRTQSRLRVSQGLDRVRTAARQRKKEKFTALLHHVTVELLKAGVLEEGNWSVSERGTPQGAVVSPLLANVYLHYVFDLWAEQWRRREATGKVIVVRYADDIVAGFEHESDARRFWDAMRTRLEQFTLELHGEKTRLLEFGRHAAVRRQRCGLGKPETFTFLGFTFICGKSRRGAFQLQRKTRSDRMRATLREIKVQLRRRMHDSIPEQGRWLQAVVRGYFAYHAVPTNARSLSAFRHYVIDIWRRTLRRRSQKDGMRWDRMTKIADAWLPAPRILHPWPDRRFAVKHPR